MGLTKDDPLFLLEWGSDKLSNNIIGFLTKALQSNSPVKIKALTVLSSLPGECALASFYLSDSNPNIREAAIPQDLPAWIGDPS